MTTTENRPARRGRSMKVRSAAAQASIALREYDKDPVPQWLRDIAAGKDVSIPKE
ncbi:hypothetical protein ACIGGF_19160 [Rhodococcus sp. NPDC078407]|uniref:Uncharacterized protein n=1 Tax=Rhodococcus navarretei TaxID=3128981 RepID=A0ABU9D2D2_9NOCA|nr:MULTISPECIES: hypothetical protein [unclassified Rhodococcus (in: high G+C Gram-positive bacteria)]MCJ0892260.1 hypothetical protein [Rhodococcus sp. ARC_M5]MCJ0978535.1 hypothetical protein [Rhodococcus sp. ARC_M12]